MALDSRSRYRRACASGAVLSGVVFLWLITEGTMNPFHHEPALAGGFFDAQVRSWFEGRWDVPLGEIGFEAFVVDGRNYSYFGPVPALLRVPVLAVTDRLDHRLSVVSMTTAFTVMMTYATALGWRIRGLMQGPDAPVSRSDAIVAFGYTLLLGAGSTVVFLASRGWAYHEAMLWAVAFALASFTYLLDHLQKPSTRALALATVFAAAAMGSRGSIGVGPVVALGVVAAASMAATLAGWRRDRGIRTRFTRLLEAPARWFHSPQVPVVRSALSVLVPVSLYAGVNAAKFGSLFRLPIDSQIYVNQASPNRVTALADNGGSLFGLKFLPTNLVQYLRPDAFELDRLFPFVTYPKQPPTIIGDVTFDGLQPASSLTVTMPIFMVLATVGLVVIARGRSGVGGAGPLPLRALALGGLAATVSVLTIAWNTPKYQIDFLPLIVVASLAGLSHLLARRRARPDPPSRRAVPALTALALLVLLTLYVNGALSLVYQRTLFSDSDRVDFVSFQQDLDEQLFGGRPPVVRTGTELPDDGRPGELVMVGECDGLYQSVGAAQLPGRPELTWQPVERTAATGAFQLVADFPQGRSSGREPLLVSGPQGFRSVLAVEYLRGDRARLTLGIEENGTWYPGDPFAVDPRGGQSLDILFDRRLLEVRAEIDGDEALRTLFWAPTPDPEISVGEGGFEPFTAARFTGRLVDQPLATPICDGLLERLADRES